MWSQSSSKLSAHSSPSPSVHSSNCPLECPSTLPLPTHQTRYPPTHLFIYPSIHLSTCPSTFCPHNRELDGRTHGWMDAGMGSEWVHIHPPIHLPPLTYLEVYLLINSSIHPPPIHPFILYVASYHNHHQQSMTSLPFHLSVLCHLLRFMFLT